MLLYCIQIVRFLLLSEDYTTLAIAFARILAAKPHSADVERLISASNSLKSYGRSRMSVDTENMYLFIHYNLPPLASWDPTPSVVHWLNRRDRRLRQRPKGKQQQYFHGVFQEASQSHMVEYDSDSEQSSMSSDVSTKKIVKAKRL